MFLRNWARLYTTQTPAERALEPAIAALGVPYRAQHPFFGLRHIADFALLDDKLIIEVDGKSHETATQIRKDLKHTLGLMKMGWRVVRCKNEEAVADPEACVRACLERATHLPTQAELEAAALELGPEPFAVRPRRRKPRRAPARL